MERSKEDVEQDAALITTLSTVAGLDTLYGDLYLQRARDLLGREIPFETYRGLLRMEGEIKALPDRIQAAMGQGEWRAVKEMTAEMQSLKVSFERYGALLPLAKKLYEQQDIFIDPFSPGLLAITGKSATELKSLREQALSCLRSLMKRDAGWTDFYTRRYFDFQSEVPLSVEGPEKPLEKESPEILQQEAQKALEKGDLRKLEDVADVLARGGEGAAAGAAGAAEAIAPLRFAFPEAVLRGAGEMGLAPFRVESRPVDYGRLGPHLWHPTFPEIQSEQGRAMRLSELPLPDAIPQALRSRIEMLVLHPFINSAGIRFIPPLVEEDALVEDFDEPSAESDMPASPLLQALGLTKRNAITRLRIEAALAAHGYRIVNDQLGLDPELFRLVCIPCDLHLRIGMNRGWGTQEIWTHFDGYMLTADGKMQALAGGDVRFGGIYDLVGIGRNYETERIILRLAVVQRRRLARLQI